jgi:hypothetical protein
VCFSFLKSLNFHCALRPVSMKRAGPKIVHRLVVDARDWAMSLPSRPQLRPGDVFTLCGEGPQARSYRSYPLWPERPERTK